MSAVLNSNVVALTPRQIKAQVDKLARLQVQLDALQQQKDFAVALLKEQGDGEYRGTAHRVVVATSTALKLDTKLARAFLTPDEIAKCSKSCTSTSARLYAL